jgi:hypothetical protein
VVVGISSSSFAGAALNLPPLRPVLLGVVEHAWELVERLLVLSEDEMPMGTRIGIDDGDTTVGRFDTVVAPQLATDEVWAAR